MADIPIIPSSGSSSSTEKKKKPKGVRDHSKDFVHRTIDVLTTPQQALVGVYQEVQNRSQGLPPSSFVDAAKKGMKEDYDWTQVFGNTPAAVAANYILDPVNVVGFTGWETMMRNAGRGFAGRAIPAIRKLPVAGRVMDDLGELFVPGYTAKHVLGMPELHAFQVEHQKRIRELMADALDPRSEEIMKLVPRQADRAKLFRMSEVPLDPVDRAVWERGVEALPKDHQKALEIFRSFITEQQDIKVKNELIDILRAEGVELASGVTYAPRYLGSPDRAVAALEKEIEWMKQLVPMGEGSKAGIEARIKGLEEARDGYLKMSQPNTLRERLIRHGGQIGTARFMNKRKLGALDEIGHLADMFEDDIPLVMEMERRDVANALAAKEYLDNIVTFLSDNKWTKTKVEAEGLKDWTRISERFPGFEDVYVPKQLAKEVAKVAEKTADPLFAPNIFSLVRRNTQLWKGITLFYAPEFYTRQFVNNITLNHLAGMPMHDFMGHHAAGLRYVQKFIWKKARPTSELVFQKTKAYPNGITEEMLFKGFVREGALGHGMVGEVDDFLRSPHHGRSKLARAIDYVGRDGPVVKQGAKLLNSIDGQSKVAHMLWRLSEGDTMAQAGASMRKFLYDPDMILTPFEKKYLRDFAAPFWGWVKFNVPLQIEMLGLYPQRIASQVKTIREVERFVGGPEPTNDFMPEWMRDASKMRVAWNPATKKWDFLFLGSWYPYAELETVDFKDARFAKKLWDISSATFKEPIEWISGNDLYTFQPIEKFPGERGNLLGIPMRKRAEAALKFLRPIAIADKAMEAYATEVAGTKQGDRIASVIRQLAIGRVYHVDQAQIKAQWESRIQRRIRELGGIRRYYEKKGDTANVKEVESIIQGLKESRKQLRKKD